MGSDLEVKSNDPMVPKKHGGPRPGAGGKPASIDLNLVRNLFRIQCTLEEVASVLHVSERTIQRHQKKAEFREAMEAGKAEGRVSVRRLLFKQAEGGNVAATIFLAKNLLGYKNTVEWKSPDPLQDDVKKAMDDLRALYGLNAASETTTQNPVEIPDKE